MSDSRGRSESGQSRSYPRKGFRDGFSRLCEAHTDVSFPTGPKDRPWSDSNVSLLEQPLGEGGRRRETRGRNLGKGVEGPFGHWTMDAGDRIQASNEETPTRIALPDHIVDS